MPQRLAPSRSKPHQPDSSTTNSQPGTHDHLRFPLSSPMTDDHTSPETEDDVLPQGDGKLATAIHASALRKLQISLPTSKTKDTTKSDGRSRRPKITVVTNMPGENRQRAPKEKKEPSSEVGKRSKSQQSSGFVTLSDLTAAVVRDQPASQGKSRRRRAGQQTVGRGGRGLEVNTEKQIPLGDASSHDVATPSIIITPAREEFALADEKPDKFNRPRARSSYYSQPSPSMYGGMPEEVPPLPNTVFRPGLLKRSLNPFLSPTATERESIISQKLGSPPYPQDRGLPEEENHSSVNRPRSLSAPHSRASLDTLATKHRSRGWWNVIVSPFLSRSNTSATERSDPFQSPPPELPSIAYNPANDARGRNHASSERNLSPVSRVSTMDEPQSAWTDATISDTNTPPNHLNSERAEVTSQQHERGSCHQVEPSGTGHRYPFVVTGDETPHSRDAPTLSTYVVSPESQGASATRSGQAGGAATHRWEHDDAPFQGSMPRGQRDQFVSPLTEPSSPYHGAFVPRHERGNPHPESQQPPPYSPPRTPERPANTARGLPPMSYLRSQPDPARSNMQQASSSRNVQPHDGALPTVINAPSYHRYYTSNPRDASSWPAGHTGLPVTMRDIEQPPPPPRRETPRERDGGGFCCSKSRKPRSAAEKKRRRCCFIWLTVFFLVMIAIILALTMTLTRKSKSHDISPSQWLNLTGYPPIPTGVSTVAQPDAAAEVSGCVFPDTKWSCALPKEQQQSVRPNQPDQPNFRFQVLFRNDSTTNTTLVHASQKNTRDEGSLKFLKERDAATDASWTASPPVPSLDEQRFMGNTTDNVTSSLKEGEVTPFYISFISTTGTVSSLQKRQSQNDSNLFPDPNITFPPPNGSPDGVPTPANLLPFPALQPVRLYDRGLATERYGFYNYFDRSIFLNSLALLNQTDSTGKEQDPDDLNGGSTAQQAAWRCTWAQTRILVQIWTKQSANDRLLPNATTTTNSSSSSSSPVSPADNFSRPGSFPYPITITLDRHGGDITKKMLYCYGLDGSGRLVSSNRTIQVENRAFGGHLLGGGQGPLGKDKITLAQGGLGGIDGGTGGCSCRWQNFLGTGSS